MRKERILLFIFLILMLIVLMPFTSAVIEGWSNWYDYSDPSNIYPKNWANLKITYKDHYSL